MNGGAGRGGQHRGRESERERGAEKVSGSSSQEQEQSSRPEHPSLSASVPLRQPPTPSWPPSWPPSSSLTYMYTLADARTCQCDQFTLETLTKIKFQVHPVARPRGGLLRANLPSRGNQCQRKGTSRQPTYPESRRYPRRDLDDHDDDFSRRLSFNVWRRE